MLEVQAWQILIKSVADVTDKIRLTLRKHFTPVYCMLDKVPCPSVIEG